MEHLALRAAAQIGLPETLERLGFNRHQRAAALGTIVVLDAGLASEDNIEWLKANGYRYFPLCQDSCRL